MNPVSSNLTLRVTDAVTHVVVTVQVRHDEAAVLTAEVEDTRGGVGTL